MERITANLSGNVRRATLYGRDQLVAPLSLIVPGVLNGSQGPLLYPADEVARNPSAWDGMPITLRHPSKDGQPISASDPDVLNSQGIGVVLGTKSNGKLTAEGWFDVENLKRIAPDVLKALESGKQLELSTGLHTENEAVAAGTKHSDGREYIAIARNYRPDHLAILPDQIGACSINDGCGVLVNQDAGGESIWSRLGRWLGLVDNQLSHRDLRMKLDMMLAKRFGPTNPSPDNFDKMPFIVDVFDKDVVYRLGDKMFRLKYMTDLRTGAVELSSDAPVEVQKETAYKPISNNSDSTPKGDDMADTKKPAVDYLIANCSCWQESDRDVLNSFSDEKLAALKQHTEAVKNAATPKPEEKPPEAKPVANAETKPITKDEWLASAPAEIKSAVENAMRIEADEKARIVERLVANTEGDDAAKTKRRAVYNAMALDQLRDIDPGEPKQQTPALPNFIGAGAGQVFNEEDDSGDVEAMTPPVINYAELAASKK